MFELNPLRGWRLKAYNGVVAVENVKFRRSRRFKQCQPFESRRASNRKAFSIGAASARELGLVRAEETSTPRDSFPLAQSFSSCVPIACAASRPGYSTSESSPEMYMLSTNKGSNYLLSRI